MSNLIKSVYFNMDPSKFRKIDSDENVEDYIPNIYGQPEPEDTSGFQPFNADAMEHIGEGFEGGVPVITMDDVVNEERAKLSEEMQGERDEILKQARVEADVIIVQAREKADEIFDQARTDGYVKGSEEARAQMNAELEKIRNELQTEYEKKFADLDEEKKNLEPAFADLVVSLVRKLTGVICEDKKEVILYLIGNAMRNLGRTSSIVLRVSGRDIALVSSKKNTLKAIAKDVDSFEVIEDDSLSEHQCIIETDSKIIDCSLDSELENLEEQIKLLAY